jgi:phospholipase C
LTGLESLSYPELFFRAFCAYETYLYGAKVIPARKDGLTLDMGEFSGITKAVRARGSCKRGLALGVLSLLFAIFFCADGLLAQGQAGIPIEHFIFVVQENHSFDNYFGTFPGANGIPTGVALASYPGGALVNKPFLITDPNIPHDLSHRWVSAILDYDNGAMDGFMWGEWPDGYAYYGRSIPIPTPDPNLVHPRHGGHPAKAWPSDRANQELISPNGFVDDEDEAAPDIQERNDALAAARPSPTGPPNPNDRPSWVVYTLSYMDYHVIPNYWEYARTFTLCDNFFCSVKSDSFPNHLYLVAAQSGGIVTNAHKYTFTFPSIIELFRGSNVTWKYYTGSSFTTQLGVWRPLPGFAAYANDPHLNDHLVQTREFYADLKRGKLPQVCWLIPPGPESEHPKEDVRKGMWYVTDLINAVMKSEYWQNCAIVLTWDESGGFYDHVPPIQTDEYGFGFRVPCLVISPYSNAGAIIHTQYDFTSLLKLVETKFGLTSLTSRDGASNTMLDCFNFAQSPLPPVIITHETKLDFSDIQLSTP